VTSSFRIVIGDQMGQADSGMAELSVSDHAQLGSLAEYLHLAVPDVQAARSTGHAGRGEQGALDVLMIAADSSVLVAVIEVLPKFLQSRKKPGLTVTVTVEKKRRQLTVTAEDPEDVRQLVDKFLDE
jgi:Effector Associated Constant Component 1